MIYDYKTGTPPSPRQQKEFDKQLLFEAAMAERGDFEGLGAVPVLRAAYIGMGGTPGLRDAPLDEEPVARIMAELARLIAAYDDPERGYAARRAMHSTREAGDYDQLARFGEWDATDAAQPVRVGR